MIRALLDAKEPSRKDGDALEAHLATECLDCCGTYDDVIMDVDC